MRLVIDIEANGLENPTEIWCVCCKDIDTGEYYTFRKVTQDEAAKEALVDLLSRASLLIGHNLLGYDYPVLVSLLGFHVADVGTSCIDTLIVSKMADYSRKKHSIEDYGLEFGLDKIKHTDFSKYSEELVTYCLRDIDITHKVYLKYLLYITNNNYKKAITTEHKFQLKVINNLSTNGFYFNTTKATTLLTKVTTELEALDKVILKEFRPKLKLIREITPKETKYGTLSRTDFRWVKDGDLSEYNGGPFCRCEWQVFNPSSHKQIVDVLTLAGWQPEEKTDTHKDVERELNILKRQKNNDNRLDIEACCAKLEQLKKYGWKINETNLDTLPPSAPSPARTLAKRIMLESRRRTLTEWLGLVDDDQRIRAEFFGIGTWTHRMATHAPNLQNIPNEFDTAGRVKLLGKELRQLWQAPRKRLLVGVDADSIQLRVFAHYVNDPDLINEIVNGKKEDKTDPHSSNQKFLGSVCKSRAAAKRMLYALFLGSGVDKIAAILECKRGEGSDAKDRLTNKYPGWAVLKETIIPKDARRGYFIGLDGRPVILPKDTISERQHLAMSGYLQNGEAVIMKMACLKWMEMLEEQEPELFWMIVNFVHDEWQTEIMNDVEIAHKVAKIQCESLRLVGEELGLNCPLAGSYWNDDHRDYTFGNNWYQTH